MLFRLREKDEYGNKVGSHFTGDREYVAGEVIKSDVDLVEVFGSSKFDRVDRDGEEPAPRQPNLPKPSTHVTISGKYGKNVTDDFVEADFAEMLVWWSPKKERFTITTEDGQTILKRAKGRNTVVKFLKQNAG